MDAVFWKRFAPLGVLVSACFCGVALAAAFSMVCCHWCEAVLVRLSGAVGFLVVAAGATRCWPPC